MMICRRFARILKLAILATGLAHCTSVNAAPLQWSIASGGNGHYYEYVGIKTNWIDAQAEAQSRFHLGTAGHLATITDLAENTFVRSLVSDNSELFWLGLYVSSQTPRDFVWVDNPSATIWRGETPSDGGASPFGAFTNWETNEPNNAGGSENYTIMYTENGRWNDTLLNRLGDGASFVIEYTVPEPAALSIAGVALFSIIHMAKRRRPHALGLKRSDFRQLETNATATCRLGKH